MSYFVLVSATEYLVANSLAKMCKIGQAVQSMSCSDCHLSSVLFESIKSNPLELHNGMQETVTIPRSAVSSGRLIQVRYVLYLRNPIGKAEIQCFSILVLVLS